MITTEVLRKRVKKYIDKADEKSLLVVEHILEKEQDESWWDKLPEEVRLSVNKAIREIDEGHGIPHEEMKKRFPQWFRR
jgi:hypothetical protein